MKKIVLIFVLFIFHSGIAETNVINGTYTRIPNPATTDPILPGIVSAVTANNIDYILTVNGDWFWEEFSWEGWTPEWTPEDSERISVTGVISVHQDLLDRTYYEIEISNVQTLDYTYTTNNGAITITGYTGSGGDVSIPSIINGLPVTALGWMAFTACYSLTNATIPDSVTTIEDRAFDLCTSLASITIPDSVTYIGSSAFSGCTSLTSVVIPNRVTSIEAWAFSRCTSLTNVTIGSGVTSIGNQAFGFCTSLPDVTISNGVTTIQESAFSGCTSLPHIILPESITHIGAGTFRYCNSLTNIIMDVNNAAYRSVNGILFNKDQTELIQYPAGKSGSSYTIPDGVTAIEGYAFDTCNNLINITIPDTVINIGVYAFGGSDSLNGIYFRGNAPSFGWDNPYPSALAQPSAVPPGTPPFVGSPNVIVYYLPGTTGWGAIFGERPTVLWNPVIQTGDGSFGVQANNFGFNVTESVSGLVVVKGCTNLTDGIWEPIQTNSMGGGTVYFSDAQWTNYLTRFYRISTP